MENNNRPAKVSFKEGWKKLPAKDRTLTVLGLIISVAVIVLAALQLLNVWDKAINVFEPLLGVLMIIQAIQNWNRSRKVAVLCLVAAAVIFLAGALILFGTVFAGA